mmetsp:Transcript_60003/g.127067  ORF Transcript_60003/g.127067 Transcript_60003/m.127067 type:complete len:101 (+) Transcript_60003:264-566(+)
MEAHALFSLLPACLPGCRQAQAEHSPLHPTIPTLSALKGGEVPSQQALPSFPSASPGPPGRQPQGRTKNSPSNSSPQVKARSIMAESILENTLGRTIACS